MYRFKRGTIKKESIMNLETNNLLFQIVELRKQRDELLELVKRSFDDEYLWEVGLDIHVIDMFDECFPEGTIDHYKEIIRNAEE
jgi:hypothetical protein